jgi:hypothetical protein
LLKYLGKPATGSKEIKFNRETKGDTMSLRHAIAFFLALQFVVVESATATLSGSTPNSTAGMSMNGQRPSVLTDSRQLLKDQWYTLNRTATVTVYNDRTGKAPNQNVNGLSQLSLVQDMEVNILDVSEDGQYVQIGIDDTVIGEMNPSIDAKSPVRAWVRVSDLLRGSLEVADTGDDSPLASMLADEYVTDYAEMDVAARGNVRAYHRGHRGHGSMTYCLRDVRLAAGCEAPKERVSAAAHAYPVYKAAGWMPVEYSTSLPIHTACFSGGGRRDCNGPCGHAAIKIGPNAWKGAGVRRDPFIAGRNFIGCLAPPNHCS